MICKVVNIDLTTPFYETRNPESRGAKRDNGTGHVHANKLTLLRITPTTPLHERCRESCPERLTPQEPRGTPLPFL